MLLPRATNYCKLTSFHYENKFHAGCARMAGAMMNGMYFLDESGNVFPSAGQAFSHWY
jgi:hypothetical protein